MSSEVKSSGLADPKHDQQHPHHHASHPPIPHKHLHLHRHEHVLLHTARIMLRNALYAALLRLAIGVLKVFMRGSFANIANRLSNELLTWNPVKWAVLTAGISSYRGIEYAFKSVGVPSSAASFLSGAVASLSLLVMNVKTRTELSLYLFVRAAHCFALTTILPRMPEPIRDFEHYDVLTMCVTAGNILYCLMFMPHCHDPGYASFLVSSTMTDKRVMAANAGVYRGHFTPELVEYALEKNIPMPTDPNHMAPLCRYYHDGRTCNENYFYFIRKHLTTFSIPLYLPLKLGTTVVLKWHKLVAKPVETTWSATKSSLSSSLFLTLYCAGPFRAICAFQKYNIQKPWGLAVAAGLLAGLPTFLEPKPRRLDLALYCVMQSLRSFSNLLWYRGFIDKPNRQDVFWLHVISGGYLFYMFDRERESLHSSVTTALCMLLKESRHQQPAASHGDGEHHHHQELKEELAHQERGRAVTFSGSELSGKV